MVTGYHLKPATAAVLAGKSVTLKLVYCSVIDTSKQKKADPKPKKPQDDELAPLVILEKTGKKQHDDELAPLVPTHRLVCEDDADADLYSGLAPLVTPKEVKWEISRGQGKVSGDKNGATYQAPGKKPDPNKATVTATLTYNVGKEKTILLSDITILDEVKSYSGTFSLRDVTVNSEYTTNLSGKITWNFTEYYDIGRWREYEGKGIAAYSIKRVWCSQVAFSNVPVEGRLKVYDDGRYEFLIGLTGDAERVSQCKRDDFRWQEEITVSGSGMNSGDPCAAQEFYPRSHNAAELRLTRQGACSAAGVRGPYQESWSFNATR